MLQPSLFHCYIAIRLSSVRSPTGGNAQFRTLVLHPSSIGVGGVENRMRQVWDWSPAPIRGAREVGVNDDAAEPSVWKHFLSFSCRG